MNIDYEAWRFWIGVFQLIGTVVLGVYVWWSNREKVTRKRFQTLETSNAQKIDEAKAKELIREHVPACPNTAKMGKVEAEFKSLPSLSDIGRVHARMDAAVAQVENLAGEMGATRRQLDLVLEELLRREK